MRYFMLLVASSVALGQCGDSTQLAGRVVWEGRLPDTVWLQVNRHHAVHGVELSSPVTNSERLIVDLETRGVAWSVVWIDGVVGERKNQGNAVVRMVNCRVQPRITLVPLNTKVFLQNDDPVLHVIHAFKDKESSFGIGLPGGRESIIMDEIGEIELRCGAGHPWESAWIHVIPHAYYAVTDSVGRFDLGCVPDGSYDLFAWHEGWQIIEVDREGGVDQRYSFSDPVTIGPYRITVKAGDITGMPNPLTLRERDSETADH